MEAVGRGSEALVLYQEAIRLNPALVGGPFQPGRGPGRCRWIKVTALEL